MNRSMCRHLFETVSLLVLMTGSFSIAQERSDGDGNGAADSSPRHPGPGPRLHLASGDMLPDVKLYTEEGEEFRTARLKGSHAVLVFGCLT